jgi:hypothetical protein
MEWLEQPNMKDVIIAGSCRQQQPVSNITHTFQYLERTKKFGSQLAASLHLERCQWPMKETKPNPLAWREL